MKLIYIPIAYFIIISLITVAVTVKDKKNARKQLFRVPEKTLFILALLGGSVAEYATMKAIRHKTMHKRFMLGLPAIIILQSMAVCVVIYMLYQNL